MNCIDIDVIKNALKKKDKAIEYADLIQLLDHLPKVEPNITISKLEKMDITIIENEKDFVVIGKKHIRNNFDSVIAQLERIGR